MPFEVIGLKPNDKIKMNSKDTIYENTQKKRLRSPAVGINIKQNIYHELLDLKCNLYILISFLGKKADTRSINRNRLGGLLRVGSPQNNQTYDQSMLWSDPIPFK